MTTMTVKTRYPCCYGEVRLEAINEVPVEVYSRKCPICMTVWEVTRSFMVVVNGARMDKLEWMDKRSKTYRKEMGLTTI